MPALPAVPKVVKIALIQALDEDIDVVNRFYVQYGGTAPTGTQLNTFCAAVDTAWGADMAARFSTSLALNQVTAEDLSSPTAAVGSASTSHGGTDNTARLSASACLVLKFQVARRYRGGHPRMYLAGFTSANLVDAQRWDPAHAGGTLTAWQTFIAAVLAAGWSGAGGLTHVNVSYYQGFVNYTKPSGREASKPVLRGAPVVDAVNSYGYNPKVCSQRRRNQSAG